MCQRFTNFYPKPGPMLISGVVTLLKEHTVCKEGNVLTPEEARLLVMITVFPLIFNIINKGHLNVP